MKPEHYPPLIEIDGKTWHVVMAPKLKNADLGWCDGSLRVICLSRDQDDGELLETFIHEVLHAAEFEFGFTLGHPKIRKLERILASVFLQLKELKKEAK